MKNAILFLLLLLVTFLTLVFQELVPPFFIFGGAHLQLIPMLFCLGAILFNFPLMIVLAFCTGALLDLMQMQIVGNSPEIAFGVGILYFLITGSVCQGLRPLFFQGAWWIFPLITALATCVLPLLQFVLISFRRFEASGLQWSPDVLWRILIPSIIAACIAPCFLYLFYVFGAKLKKSDKEVFFQ